MENNIRASVTPLENESKLKGLATVIVSDQISVHGVKIVEGEKGLFVSMPSEKAKNGKYYDTVLPANKDAYAKLNDTVLAAYEEALQHGRQQRSELNPSETSVKVSNYRENSNDSNIKGSCQIVVDDILVIKNVKVIAVKETGELSIAMPSKQDADGNYNAVAVPTSKAFFAQVKEAVIDYYQNPPQTLGNTSYAKLATDEIKELTHKSYNSDFAEKIGEQLNLEGVKWSGKIEGNKTVIAVNKSDSEKLDNAVTKANQLANEAKAAKSDTPATPDATPPKRGRK